MAVLARVNVLEAEQREREPILGVDLDDPLADLLNAVFLELLQIARVELPWRGPEDAPARDELPDAWTASVQPKSRSRPRLIRTGTKDRDPVSWSWFAVRQFVVTSGTPLSGRDITPGKYFGSLRTALRASVQLDHPPYTAEAPLLYLTRIASPPTAMLSTPPCRLASRRMRLR